MNKILEGLTAWQCDVSGALERFIDDEDLYILCLEKFAEDEGFASLEKNLKAEDYNAAFEDAHALKGVAGNLGLSHMFSNISLLVEKLRSKDFSDSSEMLKPIEKSLMKLKTIVK